MKPRLFSNSLRLGFGCSGAWGMGWFSERKAARLVRQALDLGVTHFDTGSFYCGGEAERRLGRALEGVSADDVFVSTKCGTRLDRFGSPYKNFSESALRADVETSLKRLRRERLDLLYLHGPDQREIDDAHAVLDRMRQEGMIAAVGVCGEGKALDYAVDQGAVDVIMGVYNVFYREHATVFSRAARKGVGVAAVAPLAQAVYRKGFFLPRSLPDLWSLTRALVRRRDDLARARGVGARRLENVDGWTPVQAALGFTLANPNIDVTFTTTTRAHHLADSVATARRSLPDQVIAELNAIAPLDRKGCGA
ncbi:MAG: aldo/keto reductase [Parvularculaceae bacterium]